MPFTVCNVDRTLSERDLWIGLFLELTRCECSGATAEDCEACRATWLWYEGTPMSWWAWKEGEPNIYGDCGRLGPFAWAENSCTVGLKYICEKGVSCGF